MAARDRGFPFPSKSELSRNIVDGSDEFKHDESSASTSGSHRIAVTLLPLSRLFVVPINYLRSTALLRGDSQRVSDSVSERFPVLANSELMCPPATEALRRSYHSFPSHSVPAYQPDSERATCLPGTAHSSLSRTLAEDGKPQPTGAVFARDSAPRRCSAC